MQYPQQQQHRSYSQNERPGHGPLPLALITRHAVGIALGLLGVSLQLKADEPNGKIGDESMRQRHVELDLYPEQLVCSIDDLAEHTLLPAMAVLVDGLKRDGIACTRFLPLPQGYDSARVVCDGLAMRCIRSSIVISDDAGLQRPGFRFRFDVLYSG